MAPEDQVGQKEMKCILKFEKYFHMSQCYLGERCDPWASCLWSHNIGLINVYMADTYFAFYGIWQQNKLYR
jgi:hypothetical protein